MSGELNREPLPQKVDVVVVGGGINGVAIARECAIAGRKVLLLERHDFASGTTSRSTRIIHGGLRYLEHGEIGLVRESLHERERLLAERPHLVRSQEFVLAMGDRGPHSSLEIRAGLWLYRMLCPKGTQQHHHRTNFDEICRSLDDGHRWALYSYDDAQCEFPERLVAEWLVEACSHGATVRNHAEVFAIRTTDGRVRGVRVRDMLTAQESFVETEWVINATGPWADEVYSSAGLSSRTPLIGGVRGSHLMLRRFSGAPEVAVYTQAIDGRPFFVIPWNGLIMVGTTEVRQTDSPEHVQPTADEMEYLLNSVRSLYPRANLGRDDVVYAYAGVRPLAYSDDMSGPKKIQAMSRRHMIRNHAADGALGMLTIVGGKLTTAESLARQTARHLGLEASERKIVQVAKGSASGIESTFQQWARAVSSAAGISERSARAIACWNGRRALSVVQSAAANPLLRRPIVDGKPQIVAQACEAVRYESAVTLGDILLRRTPLALDGDWEFDHTLQAAERIGAGLAWTESRIRTEVEQFEEERARFLVTPEKVKSSQVIAAA